MGKKSKIFYYSVLIVNTLFFILDILFEYPFFRISFPVSLTLVGILLIIRAVNYKFDSSMFFGVTLTSIGIINLIEKFSQNITTYHTWPYLLVAVAVASLTTAIYFKDKLQAKLCVLFFGFGLISILFTNNLMPLWLFITLMIVWFVGYFAYNIIKAKRRK